jgi:hypothetical protein
VAGHFFTTTAVQPTFAAIKNSRWLKEVKYKDVDAVFRHPLHL